ncbi:hypothetical protein ACRRTK_000039 [Alexandromys fortis]
MGEGKVREIQSLRNAKILSPQLLEGKKDGGFIWAGTPLQSPRVHRPDKH